MSLFRRKTVDESIRERINTIREKLMRQEFALEDQILALKELEAKIKQRGLSTIEKEGLARNIQSQQILVKNTQNTVHLIRLELNEVEKSRNTVALAETGVISAGTMADLNKVLTPIKVADLAERMEKGKEDFHVVSEALSGALSSQYSSVGANQTLEEIMNQAEEQKALELIEALPGPPRTTEKTADPKLVKMFMTSTVSGRSKGKRM
ncbi:MAG: hypothetical protein JSS82_00160 [Bacteroidetes bacterium]|nr:hypothetical protein [Bacteroidota bacterium]